VNDIDRLEDHVFRLEKEVSLLKTVLRSVSEKLQGECPLPHTHKLDQWDDDCCDWCGTNIPGQYTLDKVARAERKAKRQELALSRKEKARVKSDL
jgi:hypothetical protein